jgi:hypothetical protein
MVSARATKSDCDSCESGSFQRDILERRVPVYKIGEDFVIVCFKVYSMLYLLLEFIRSRGRPSSLLRTAKSEYADTSTINYQMFEDNLIPKAVRNGRERECRLKREFDAVLTVLIALDADVETVSSRVVEDHASQFLVTFVSKPLSREFLKRSELVPDFRINKSPSVSLFMPIAHNPGSLEIHDQFLDTKEAVVG